MKDIEQANKAAGGVFRIEEAVYNVYLKPWPRFAPRGHYPFLVHE
jgi:hypothetical protein